MEAKAVTQNSNDSGEIQEEFESWNGNYGQEEDETEEV